MKNFNSDVLSKIDLLKLSQSCYINSDNLYRQAKKFYKNKQYNFSIFFSITALEEILKIQLIDTYKDKYITGEQLSTWWSNHTEKLTSKVSAIVVSIDEDKKIQQNYIKSKRERVSEYSRDREKSLYVDIVGGKVIVPSMMTEEKAKHYLSVVEGELRFNRLLKHLSNLKS